MSRSSLRWPADKRPLLVKHLAVSLCALVSANLAWVTGIVAATPAGALPSAHLGERTPGPERKILQGGWYPWDPYQYREARHGVQILTGFDVEIERAVARAMGVDLILTDIPWDQHLAGLAAGTVDIGGRGYL
jgi:ABC-type amino acid transport substrate-binding protein